MLFVVKFINVNLLINVKYTNPNQIIIL